MVKRVYLLLLLLLFLPLGYSLDCQYQKEIDKVDFEISDGQVVLTNTNDYNLNFQIAVSYVSPESVFCGEVDRVVQTQVSLSPHDTTSIILPEGSSNPLCSSPEWTGDYSIEYEETSEVAVFKEEAIKF